MKETWQLENLGQYLFLCCPLLWHLIMASCCFSLWGEAACLTELSEAQKRTNQKYKATSQRTTSPVTGGYSFYEF